jgi:DNA polymerase I-like protein with 3'-5' exonuclease and polymerase domains
MFNLYDYIPKWSKIITFGRMLYAITETNQVSLEGNYDCIMFNTNIFIPEYSCQVFPIETYDRSLFSSSFENYFARIQMNIARDFNIKPRRIPKKNCVHITDTTKFFKDHMNETLVSVDIEADGLDWLTVNIGSIQISFDSKTGYFLDWENVNVDELSDFLEGKKLILQNGKYDGKVLIQNGVRRDSFIIYADTMNMSHCINELRKVNLKGLQAYYTDYFGYDRELEEFKEKYPNISYIDMPFDLRLKYGCYDPCVTFEIYEKMLEEMKTIDLENPLDNGNSLEAYFFNEVMPTVNTHLDSEMVGVNINVEELYRNGIFFHRKIQDLKTEIRRTFHITDKSINVSSGKQMSEVFKNLGWKDQGLNKDGSYTMDSEALAKFVEAGYKEANLIVKLHTLETLHNTFVGYPKFKNNEEIDLFGMLDTEVEDTHKFDGFVFPEKLDMGNIELGKGTGYWKMLRKTGRGKYKVFPKIRTCMARSHRHKNSNPNLANIPNHGEFASRIRRIFIPPKDHSLLSADQSGLQMRNVSFLLEEGSPLRDVFLKFGGDAHSITGCKVLNNNKIPLEEFLAKKKSDPIIAELRQRSKAFNFGLLFGAGAYTIKNTIIEPNWSEKDIMDFIIEHRLTIKNDDPSLTVAIYVRNKYYEEYWGLSNWIDKTKRKAKKDGFVRSSYGSFRRTPYLLVKPSDRDKLDSGRYANYENISLNTAIQTLETVIMDRTLNNTDKWLKVNNKKSRFITSTHDELTYYAHDSEKKELSTVLKYYAELTYKEFNGIDLEMEGELGDYHRTARTTRLNKEGKEESAWQLWHINAKSWDDYVDKDLLESFKLEEEK